MSADPLEHKVPRHVPGEQYEKAYDLANRRGKQVIELRQKLAEAEAALAESRGEVERLTRERDEAIATKVWLRQRLDETELTARTYASQARAAEEQRRTGL